MATPLSAVRTTLVLSCLSCVRGSTLCWVEVAVVVVLLLLFLKKSVTLISFMGFSAILSALQPFQIYILNRKNGKLTFSNGPQLMEKRFMVNCHASFIGQYMQK